MHASPNLRYCLVASRAVISDFTSYILQHTFLMRVLCQVPCIEAADRLTEFVICQDHTCDEGQFMA
jgi:hypothetical protein